MQRDVLSNFEGDRSPGNRTRDARRSAEMADVFQNSNFDDQNLQHFNLKGHTLPL